MKKKKTIDDLLKFFDEKFLATINQRFLFWLGYEELLQIQCVDYLKKTYPDVIFFHPKNENGFNSITQTEKYRINRMGLLKGVHDLIILECNKTYHGLSIELKSPEKHTVSEHQIAFRNKMIEKGYYSEICNSFESFVNIVDYYMSNRTK